MTHSTKSTGLSRRKFLKGTAGVAGAAAVVSTFGIGTARAQLKQINFITPFGYLIGFSPVLNAKAGGHFEDAGLDVTVLPGKGSSMAIQQTVADRAQFVRLSGIDIVKSRDKGATLIAIATIAQSSPFFVVSPGSAAVRNPKDFVGKTIGVVSVGGGTENLLDVMLANVGIEPSSVRREVVGNGAGAYGLIKEGRIDAYIVSIGTVVRLHEAGENIHTWNTDEGAKMPGQVYATKQETIDNDPETVTQFLTAVNASVQDLFSNKDTAFLLDRMLGEFDILGAKDKEFTMKAMREEETLWLTEGAANVLRNVPARWQSITDGLVKAGLVGPTDAESNYTNVFIDKVLA
ncbi:MAG: ABC transporter substrate-binding protein [Proteobacteria bacterium]|nr:ABC transporter substrate-binding protein [Pseudomonadota bacterium]